MGSLLGGIPARSEKAEKVLKKSEISVDISFGFGII